MDTTTGWRDVAGPDHGSLEAPNTTSDCSVLGQTDACYAGFPCAHIAILLGLGRAIDPSDLYPGRCGPCHRKFIDLLLPADRRTTFAELVSDTDVGPLDAVDNLGSAGFVTHECVPRIRLWGAAATAAASEYIDSLSFIRAIKAAWLEDDSWEIEQTLGLSGADREEILAWRLAWRSVTPDMSEWTPDPPPPQISTPRTWTDADWDAALAQNPPAPPNDELPPGYWIEETHEHGGGHRARLGELHGCWGRRQFAVADAWRDHRDRHSVPPAREDATELTPTTVDSHSYLCTTEGVIGVRDFRRRGGASTCTEQLCGWCGGNTDPGSWSVVHCRACGHIQPSRLVLSANVASAGEPGQRTTLAETRLETAIFRALQLAEKAFDQTWVEAQHADALLVELANALARSSGIIIDRPEGTGERVSAPTVQLVERREAVGP